MPDEDGDDAPAGDGDCGGAGEPLLRRFLARLRSRPLPVPPPFPDPERTGPPYCVARGPSITPELVLEAYGKGIFPMGERPGVIEWYCPDPRAVLDVDALHVPRRLARTLRQGRFEVRVDTAFEDVVAGCAARRHTWISREVRATYAELHRRGAAHSVEAWRDGALAGGLYGVSLGGAFFAESMFHAVTDASKVAVVALADRLRARGFRLLDIQYVTRATAVFAPRLLPRREYLARLRAALALPCTFVDA